MITEKISVLYYVRVELRLGIVGQGGGVDLGLGFWN